MGDSVPPVLVDKVVKDYRQLRALSEVSLTVEAGELFGLIGPNGSGKTTLIHLLLGLGRPSRGEIRIFGRRMPNRAAAASTGYMTQATALYGDLSVRENLAFFARLYGLDGQRLRERTAEVLRFVELSDRIDSTVRSLSGGMRQRVSLAIALLHRPSLLVLDEPTVGIDPELRIAFWEYFRQAASAGTAIIVSTHHLDEAMKCHRIALLRAGHVLALDTPQGLLEESGEQEFDRAFLYFASRKGGG